MLTFTTWVGGVVKALRVLELIRVNLRHLATFYYEEASNIAVWWAWNIPFQLLQVAFSLLLFKYYALAFGGASPLYGDNFMAFIISGLMVNTYMDCALSVYYEAVGALYLGRVGLGGVHLSRRDYLQLAGISPYVFMFARVSWRFLMETVMFILYFVIGVLFFDFSFSTQGDPALALIIILLGIAACSGLGLISASMYWIAGSYRGVEPISWFIRVAVPLVAGVYIPPEVLPEELRMIGRVLPQTYVISAVREVMLKGAALSEVAPSLVVLAVQAAVLVPLGILLLKLSLSLARRRATMY